MLHRVNKHSDTLAMLHRINDSELKAGEETNSQSSRGAGKKNSSRIEWWETTRGGVSYVINGELVRVERTQPHQPETLPSRLLGGWSVQHRMDGETPAADNLCILWGEISFLLKLLMELIRVSEYLQRRRQHWSSRTNQLGAVSSGWAFGEGTKRGFDPRRAPHE